MPYYEFLCEHGHRRGFYASIKSTMGAQGCAECGGLMQQVIFAPLLVKAAQEVCYDSPIDGAPITSWDARREDLKRHHCRPYDPEMKKDAERFRQQQDQALDHAIETHVEEVIEKMPTAKRGKLMSELTSQGAEVEYVRSTIEP